MEEGSLYVHAEMMHVRAAYISLSVVLFSRVINFVKNKKIKNKYPKKIYCILIMVYQKLHGEYVFRQLHPNTSIQLIITG